MVPIMTSNEDSQTTQLRIGKKVAAPIKRSRFTKPRPNLAISKRGESNVSVGASSIKKHSDEKIAQASSSDIETNKSSQASESQITSNTSADKTSQNGDNAIVSKEEKNKSSQNVISMVISNEEKNKSSQNGSSTNISNEEKNETPENSHSIDLNSETSLQKIVQITPNNNTNEKIIEEDIQDISDGSCKPSVPEKDIQFISNTNIEIPVSEGDTQTVSNLNAEKNSPTEDVQAVLNTVSEKQVSKKDVQVTHLVPKSPLKASEPEKRSILNATPTVIDKSKYPHLTNMLSKKRTEPRKEVQQKRRRKFKKGDAPPERSKMTMADLIYWNPVKTEESQKTTKVNKVPSTNINLEETEECVDNVDENENNIQDSVPKLVISEDGQIHIDQSSLIISRNIPQPTTTEVVRKDDTTYSSFRKRPLTKHWTAKDTANFYRALSLVGADFSLMEQIFPNRTRRELKQKFKREEKFNIDIINKVLYESLTFDELTLNDFMDQNSTIDDPDSVNETEDTQTTVKEKKTKKQKTSEKTKPADEETQNSSDQNSVDHPEENENETPEKNKKRKKKTNKVLDDDENVEILVNYKMDCNDHIEREGSKRIRSIKKLPDDFISLDSIEDLYCEETNSNDSFGKILSSENPENNNDIQEEIPETALEKIVNVTDNTDVQQNYEEVISNKEDAIISLPSVINEDEEYITVKYIKNDDSETDLTMLGNVMAYEDVNTQIPVRKRKRKVNPIIPVKTRESCLSIKIPPPNYTNFTPV